MTSYLFIDGGCLRVFLGKVAETYANGSRLDISYATLTHGYDKVFYYDALPGRHLKELRDNYDIRVAPERELFKKLSLLDRFHVHEGEVRRASAKRGMEQKKIDVMIAVDMLTHTFRRNMQEATLLTGDLDFKPLIDALVRDGMFVNLWYPPQAPEDLIASADRGQKFLVDHVHMAIPGTPKPFNLPAFEAGLDRGEYAPPVLAKWSVDDDLGRDARLMKDAARFSYVVMVPDPDVPSYTRNYLHKDLKILRAYLKDLLGVSVPEVADT